MLSEYFQRLLVLSSKETAEILIVFRCEIFSGSQKKKYFQLGTIRVLSKVANLASKCDYSIAFSFPDGTFLSSF